MRRAILVIIGLAIGACGGGDGGSDDVSGGPGGPYFVDGAFFDQDVTGVTPAGNSAAIIGALRAAGGWGNGDVFQIDFSIDATIHSEYWDGGTIQVKGTFRGTFPPQSCS